MNDRAERARLLVALDAAEDRTREAGEATQAARRERDKITTEQREIVDAAELHEKQQTAERDRIRAVLADAIVGRAAFIRESDGKVRVRGAETSVWLAAEGTVNP